MRQDPPEQTQWWLPTREAGAPRGDRCARGGEWPSLGGWCV